MGIAMKASAGLIAMALLLSACASSGTLVTEQQAAQFQKGVTTRAAVLGALGAPNSTSFLDDGRRLDVYVHVHASADAVDYIPVVGLIAGGASATSNTASFTYDPNGILQSISTSAGESDVHTGLLNQGQSGGGVAPAPSAPAAAAATSAPQGTLPPCATHDEQVQARIARMNGYTSGPKCQ